MLSLYDSTYNNRLILGTSLYPTLETMKASIIASGAELVTVSLRRQMNGDENNYFWQIINELNCDVLPNTAGCYTAKEAIVTAQMAREVFNTNKIKLEVIGNSYNLQPDPFELLEATRILVNEGFDVLPYCTDDIILCERLLEAGCKVLMPWAAPIGTGKGLLNPYQFRLLRERFKHIPIVIDAGLGEPAHACEVMGLGADAVMLNTAVAKAQDPVKMARAFSTAIEGGRLGYEAGKMLERDLAAPSTPTVGTPFWHENDQVAAQQKLEPIANKNTVNTIDTINGNGLGDFKKINKERLIFYPIVDRSCWIPRLAKAGCKSVQLRIKDLQGKELKEEIKAAILFAREYHIDLYINDHWQLAIELGAFGVHLGQEDLETADLNAIYQANLAFGVSTHDKNELARITNLNASYVAFGPIFETQSKKLAFSPQGLERLAYWRKLVRRPLVAIGGIDLNNIADVYKTKVDGVAAISLVTNAENPEQVIAEVFSIQKGVINDN
ncbi:thiamine phosphate synthase [Piscirickettsia litoralis]|uniref:Multifunctional fusion protein n=1 Tax=Piscirickettsia litoralis TaxID=1891921 RepID=A0ABX3A6S0_9GAMM|nr:thiamine phosphate synthase [Piscirickettsia litoralis]ODN41804.1 thiamine-phosphate diphosphorylase [Piscirickettsia litoralis]